MALIGKRSRLWTSGSGADQRHLSGFSTVSVGTKRGVPVSRFLRTLDPGEPDPELRLRIRWARDRPKLPVGGLKQERVPGLPPGFADAVVAGEDRAALNMLVIAPAREAGCGRRTPIARSQSSRITMTEARDLPEHATTVERGGGAQSPRVPTSRQAGRQFRAVERPLYLTQIESWVLSRRPSPSRRASGALGCKRFSLWAYSKTGAIPSTPMAAVVQLIPYDDRGREIIDDALRPVRDRALARRG